MFDNLPQLPPDWNVALKSYLPQNCLDLIDKRLSEGHHPIYPPKHQIFRAFELTPFDKVTVVFLGQDPYHGAMEACGICFGVPDSIKPPPSLKNMIKELKNDLGEDLDSQELLQWARHQC